MEGIRHFDLQYMALVASHRTTTTVKIIFSFVFNYNFIYGFCISPVNGPKHLLIYFGSRWDYIQEGRRTYKDMDRLVAFEKGLNTWGRWVDSNLDPAKTKVFFQGVSPDHSQ